MASFLPSQPLQHDHPISFLPPPFNHSPPNRFKPHSFPHFLPLPADRHSLSSRRPHAGKVTERMPRREPTHLRSGRTVADGGLVVEEKKKKQRFWSRNGGSRGHREMGRSGSSLKRSREERADGKSEKNEGNPMMVQKMERSKKDKGNKAEVELKIGLDRCSKSGDVRGAIHLYDSAIREGLKLQQYHYNVLLYLCSAAAIGFIHPAKSGSGSTRLSSGSSHEGDRLEAVSLHDIAKSNSAVGISSDDSPDRMSRLGDRNDSAIPIQVSDDTREYARTRGFEIYERMCSDKIPMSEAALTSVARMAMSMDNGDMAFEIVKQMKALGITPRLRSYGPAIFAFCNNGDIDKAFEVERHMVESGVRPEEPELEALLRASVRACRAEKVYYLLHKLRTSVRQVSPLTADLIKAWFKSSTASRVGKRKWDKRILEQAMESGGGGWHGLGWLGKGKWSVTETYVDENGICQGCGEKLMTIDLDPTETKEFARSVASIARNRERNSSFQKFQKWLDYYGPFEAVVDAANVGLFSQRKFSLSKVNAVVNAMRQKLPSKKWPLIIVHNRRLIGGRASEPLNEKLIEKWKNADAIYATPTGSNDDWYWLYAAIKCKCLIVTNDEMRDHVFQILGNDFFPKWKERHQVRFSFHDGNFEFHMPPPCSIVIQESGQGCWHIPILSDDESRREMKWLCVIRGSSNCSIQPNDVQAGNHVRLSSDDDHEQSCYPSDEHPRQKINRSLQRNKVNTKFPKSNSIIPNIKAAEKLSGCIIDFQI